jgi:sec-independent protein translocase protein TatB
MLDIGWSEMLIVGVVALVVVGPKDLPKMFHSLGEFTGKARAMAREFQSAMNAAAKESGVGDVTNMVKTMRKANPTQALKDAVGFDDIDKEFRDIGHERPSVRKPSQSKVDPQTAKPAEAGVTPKSREEDVFDGAGADEAAVADHDAALARRNAEMSAVETERLRKQKQVEAARLKAAAIRARKEAEAAEAAAAAAAEEAAPQQWQPRSPSSDPKPES